MVVLCFSSDYAYNIGKMGRRFQLCHQFLAIFLPGQDVVMSQMSLIPIVVINTKWNRNFNSKSSFFSKHEISNLYIPVPFQYKTRSKVICGITTTSQGSHRVRSTEVQGSKCTTKLNRICVQADGIITAGE